MSTLVAQTISNGTVSTSSANVIRGSARAWANWDGSNGTIRSSYNVSSVTRNSTGQYTVNFTNAFANSNYVATGGGGGQTRNNTLTNVAFPQNLFSTSSLGVDTQYSHVTAFDPPIVCVSCFA